ncbi:MAG TPA: hypothetical protein PLR74_15080, partial [Agriterribacter sp.]|nr:hypothetical protein [Agriterribacter sp.]
MKSANLLTVVWLGLSTAGFTQTIHSPLVSYYPSSGAYSKSFRDAFSIISNTGALCTQQGLHAGVYGERRFMMAETSLYTTVVTLPAAPGNLALQADYSGYKDYSESQIGIAYGLALNEDIGIGAKFNYYHLRIPSHLSASAVNFEIGSVMRISNQLYTGVSVYNPLNSPLGKHTGEKIASVYKAGIGYEASPSFFSQLEIIKEKDRDVNVHAGLQYKPLEQLFARAGIFTGATSGYFGVGCLYRQLRVDISVSFHQQ